MKNTGKIIGITLIFLSSIIFKSVNADSLHDKYSISIPFTLNNSNLPILKLDVEGKTYPFILDTGSSIGLHVTPEFLDKFSERIIEKKKIRTTDLAGKEVEQFSYIFSHIIINGHRFKNIEVIPLYDWGLHLSDNDNTENTETMVAGYGLIHGMSVLLDYKNQILLISDSAANLMGTKSDWRKIPMKLAEEGIVIQASFEGTPKNMVIDSASSTSAFFPKKSGGTFDTCQKIYGEAIIQGDCRATLFNLKAENKTYNIPTLILNRNFEHFTADGVIGSDFLKAHDLIIDYKNKNIFIKN